VEKTVNAANEAGGNSHADTDKKTEDSIQEEQRLHVALTNDDHEAPISETDEETYRHNHPDNSIGKGDYCISSVSYRT
jgi:hypothetical protein